MKARTLNRLLGLSDTAYARFEKHLEDLFAETLTEVAKTAGDRFRASAGHVAAAAPSTTSAMVAVYPTDEQQAILGLHGTEPSEEIHCTLAFLGEVDPDQAEAIAAIIRNVAAEFGPLSGEIGGVASFGDNGNGHPSILLPDVVGLAELRQAVVSALEANGVEYATNHGWTPHLTLSYTETPTTPPGHLIGRPLDFGELSISVGDVRRDYALGTVEPALVAAGKTPPPNWIQPHPDELVDVKALVAKFRGKSDPVRQAVVETVAKKAIEKTGVGFDVTNPLIDGVLSKTGSQITFIADTTRLNVMRIVRNSYDQGLSIPDTANAIREGMLAATPARATLIARTEMAGLVNGGSLAATQIVDQSLSEDGSGGVYQKRWLTAPGAQYPRHETYDGLDGQTVPLDAFFDLEGVQLQYPGDPDGPPEEVCNCRCTLVYVDSAGQETEGDESAVAAALPYDETEGGGDVPRISPRSILEDSLSAAASGSTDLPLSDRDVAWDAAAAVKSLDPSDYAKAAFWTDPDGDTETQAAHKLWFAKNDGGLVAVWGGITAAAGAIQGARGGVEIPDADVAGVKSRIEGYYAKARTKYGDDSIKVPWDSGEASEAALENASEEVFAANSANSGVSGFGNTGTLFVRIRPDIEEFEIEVEKAAKLAANRYRATLRAELADLPGMMPSDVRPERTDGAEADIELPPAGAGRASQVAWEAALIPEGQLTDDGRLFAPESITWRDLPLSLMAMTATPGEGGHAGAELAGRIDRIWRDESSVPAMIRAEGVFDDSEFGQNIARLVGDQTLRGNSVDLAIREAEFGPRDLYVDENGLWKADAPGKGEVETDPIDLLFGDESADLIMVARDAVIGMSTVCPFPAFGDAGIVLASGDEIPEMAVASDATGFRWRFWLKESIAPVADVVTASAAGLVPEEPPVAWFEDPGFTELTPLTVTDDGRVFGHAAPWGVCHIGIPGACTEPPESKTDYAYFHLKEIAVEGGERVSVGTITLGTGHAGKSMTPQAVAAHYDHSGAAAADVRVGEDEFGIWVAGAVRPDVAAGRVRELRGASLSGDWRRIDGNLELVALLAVNVPGFPVPRTQVELVASAEEIEVVSLVAAGVIVAPEKLSDLDRGRLAALAARAAGGLEGLAALAATDPPAVTAAAVWDAEKSLYDIMGDIEETLNPGDSCSWYVLDIAVGGDRAIIVDWDSDDFYLVEITYGDDEEPIVPPASEWMAIESTWVEEVAGAELAAAQDRRLADLAARAAA